MVEKQTQEVKHLIKIERQIDEIKKRTDATGRAFFYGLLTGAGWIIGAVAAVSILGWVLSLLGIIPGFGAIVSYLQSAVAHWQVR